MVSERHEKRRSAKSLPSAPGSRRRRGLWLMIGFSVIVFVVIVIFETQHELARQRQAAAPGNAADSGDAPVAAGTAAPMAEPVTLLGRLKEHYRSHDLPRGWTVGAIDAPSDMAAVVRIVFSPSPQDSRYGQGAPAEDVFAGQYCPEGDAFWSGLEDRRVTVELGDKGGTVKTIACEVAGAK